MFRLVVEKELREIIGTTKFAVTFGVCSVLLLLAFYVGARNYQVSRAEYDAAQTENLRQMEGLTDWNQVTHRVFLPPQPLATLVSGISNDIGRTTEMRGRGELRAENSRFNEDPIYAVFRFLDLEFIFGIVLSLFAILFAYDAINGEKERGTLRLSFANAVPRDKYILGKLVGSFLALAVPLLVPILIGCLMLPMMNIPMTGSEWMRLGMVVLAGYLYLGVFLTLSVFISALTHKSSTSFLMLLVVWIFAVLIIPRAAVLVAGRAVEVPSIDKINYDKSRYMTQLWEEDREKMNAWMQENSMPRDGDREEWMKNFRSYMSELSDVRDEKSREFGGRLNEERRNREGVQQGVALGIARLSPTSVFSLASTDLAGTSLELKQRYTESAAAYQQTYAQFMREKTGEARGGIAIIIRGRGEEEEEPDPIDPYELPAFEYQPPSTSETINEALFDIGVLLMFNIVFFVGAFAAFLRYDVR
ncbi:MAG: ABC transporter permease subunit [Rhodothermales bacterium]